METLTWQCKKWTPLDENTNKIFIDTVEPLGFAVRKNGLCLNKDSEFEYEPLPSNRDDEFYERCRFVGIEEAQKAYEKWNNDSK